MINLMPGETFTSLENLIDIMTERDSEFNLISRLTFVSLEELIKGTPIDIPSSLYYIYHIDVDLLYIGSTTGLPSQRILGHMKNKDSRIGNQMSNDLGFTYSHEYFRITDYRFLKPEHFKNWLVSIRPVHRSYLFSVEQLEIEYHTPPLNTQYIRRGRDSRHSLPF